MQIASTFKKHRKWFIWGGIALGLFVLWILFTRGSGGGSTTVVQSGADPQSQAINAELQLRQMEMQGQLAIATMQAQAQESAGDKELAALAAQLNNQLAIADLQTSAQLEALAIESANNKYIADLEHQATMQSISSQENLAIAQMEQQAASDAIAAELELKQDQLFAELQLGQQQAMVDMLAIQTSGQVQQSKIAADAQKSQGLFGMIGGLGSALIGGLFSDIRTKKNIRFEGYRESGTPYYSYEYIGSDQRQYGVLAQEAAGLHPGAIDRNNGYLSVDYRRV